jgi:hypothetical protein
VISIDDAQAWTISEVLEALITGNTTLKFLGIEHSGVFFWERLIRALLTNLDNNLPCIEIIRYKLKSLFHHGFLPLFCLFCVCLFLIVHALRVGWDDEPVFSDDPILSRIPRYLIKTSGSDSLSYAQALFTELGETTF